jgi:aminopeptidase N
VGYHWRVKRWWPVASPAIVLAIVLTGCDGTPSSSVPTSQPPVAASYAQWQPAISRPREDSYYPAQGDPGIDALHYGLDLTWDPDRKRLTGVATIAFRAPHQASKVRLDLLKVLDVSDVSLDDRPTRFRQRGNDLLVDGTFTADSDHTVVITYAGSPRPVPAPTTRDDFDSIGWRTVAHGPEVGEVWAMQEPFGSFTWFPSNDQPADKAFYDFVLRVPKQWVGIANGQLTSDVVDGATRVMSWHLSHPAATYLTTIAIGDYVRTSSASASGVPIDFWTRNGDTEIAKRLQQVPSIMDWLESKLGPYPFDSLGFIIVPGLSGMETQTMITLGDNQYATSPEVLEHEMVHQWYGDLVTPTDWRDVWMNEGMTMFLQMAWEADQAGVPIDQEVDGYRLLEISARAENGPPGDYLKGTFGEGNIYYSPALMWNQVRHQLGDEKFWEMVRAWPQVHAYGNATRTEYYRWLEENYGLERDFLDGWIMGNVTPQLTNVTPS